jgi:hypothetical protein
MSFATSSKRARGVSFLKVLGILAILVVLVCAGVGTWLYMNAKSLIASGVQAVVVEMVEQSELPDDQKTSILANIDGLAEDLKNDKLSMAEFGRIFEKLGEGPFFNLVMIEAVEAQYMNRVSPNEEEKLEAALAFDRFERGIVEEKLSDDQVEEAMALVQTAGTEDAPQMKEGLTADDLRAFVDKITQLADEAEIPSEPFVPDFAGQFQAAIDAVRGGAAETAPAA